MLSPPSSGDPINIPAKIKMKVKHRKRPVLFDTGRNVGHGLFAGRFSADLPASDARPGPKHFEVIIGVGSAFWSKASTHAARSIPTVCIRFTN